MFDELLGFAVLTGPLWLILLLLPLSIWVAARVSRRFAPGRTRFLTGAGVFVLVFLLLFADEIAGRMYFNYLCATQAGVKVYQTVELPGEYWDGEGRPKFVDERAGGFLLGERYPPRYQTGTYSVFFHIDNAGYSRIDKESGQALGEITDFRYWGGWIRRNFSPSNTANSCASRIERSNSLIRQVFKQKSN